MPRIRHTLALALTAVLALNLLNLGAAAYMRLAEARLDRLPDAQAEAASAVANALAPWSAPAAGLHGWILAESLQADAAITAYADALRWAPADPLLWDEFALALARNRLFDARLRLATERALTLAPTSPAVRESVSAMGLAYWGQGSSELRSQWSQSLRWTLDHDRRSLLQMLEAPDYRNAFCLHYAADLGESALCQRRT